jgi:hypothetical protein
MAQAAAAGAAVDVPLEMLETITFIEFIYEEAIQTELMAIYIALKNSLWKQGREVFKHLVDTTLPRAMGFVNTYGYLAPWSKGVFIAYYDSALEQAKVYQKIFKVEYEDGIAEYVLRKMTFYGMMDVSAMLDWLPTPGTDVVRNYMRYLDYLNRTGALSKEDLEEGKQAAAIISITEEIAKDEDANAAARDYVQNGQFRSLGQAIKNALREKRGRP